MEEYVTIAKKAGIKNCVRINKESDIPEFLKDVIKVLGEELVLDCLEGIEKCPVGSVIAYEKLDNGKMNVWNKANWKETTREVDGFFYEIPKLKRAARVSDTIPEEIVQGLGDKFSVLPNGDFQIKTDWGLATCAPNNGYVVIYGTKEDGTLDANFLAKGTPSYNSYYVIDENGNIIESLAEYDQRIQEEIARK